MRKLRLMTQLSADGFIADVDGKTDWMIWNWGPDWAWDDELKMDFNAIHATVDSILLSRKMAEEGFIDHWKRVAEENSEPQYEFAHDITKAHKVIFTKTLATSVWEKATLANGDFVDEIKKLKNQNGNDIIAYGGATFASSLIKANVIDEYHLLINPTVLGKGKAIFNAIGRRLNLQLKNAKAYHCGVAALMYEKISIQ